MSRQEELQLDITILPELVNKDLTNKATVAEQRFLWRYPELWKAILSEKELAIAREKQKFQAQYDTTYEEFAHTPYDERVWDAFVEEFSRNMALADTMLEVVQSKMRAIEVQQLSYEPVTEEQFAVDTDELVPDFDDVSSAMEDFNLFHKNWHYGYFHGAKKMHDYFVLLTKEPGLKQHEILALLEKFINTRLRPWIETEESIPVFTEWRKEQNNE